MAQAAADRSIDLDAITFTLGQRAEGILAIARRVTLANVALVFGMLLVGQVLERVLHLAPSELERYIWVDTKRGSCVAQIVVDGKGTRAYFGEKDRLPNPSTIPDGTAGLPKFAGGALVGRRVRTASGAEGIVRKTSGAPVTNQEQLVLDTGDYGTIAGSCEPSE